MDAEYVQQNTHERERLIRIAGKLSDPDLKRPLPNGWTVAGTLAHLAFWDLYYVSLVREWDQNNQRILPKNVDAIDYGVDALAGAVPPATAARMACEAAASIDNLIENVEPDVAAAIVAAGCRRTLYRCIHRREHLNAIERALAAVHGQPLKDNAHDTTIRAAVPTDVAAIGALWTELTEFHRQFHPDYYAQTAGAAECFGEYVTGGLGNPAWHVAVAERDGRVLAYCLATVKERPPVMQERRFGTISDLAVTAHERRRGLGERLVRDVEQWLAGRGVKRIEVCVTAANPVSTAFWRKMGYSRVLETLFREWE